MFLYRCSHPPGADGSRPEGSLPCGKAGLSEGRTGSDSLRVAPEGRAAESPIGSHGARLAGPRSLGRNEHVWPSLTILYHYSCRF